MSAPALTLNEAQRQKQVQVDGEGSTAAIAADRASMERWNRRTLNVIANHVVNGMAKLARRIEGCGGRGVFEHGYAAASIDAVIERIGGSKRNIYTTFGSKEGLFTALVSENAEQIFGPC